MEAENPDRVASGKVLFVIHDLYQDDVHFPLGIAYLASALLRAGATVDIYDMAVHHYTNEELSQFLDEQEYDLIGVSFLAARFKETGEPLLNVISDHKKDAWLVVGGHGPAPIPAFILQTTPTDIVATGDAEDTIVELLDSKVNGGDLNNIKGIAYKANGTTFLNERRYPVKDLDSIPFPAWDLFDMEKYTTSLKLFGMKPDDKAIGILTSRGCVGKCSFCYRMEKGVRLRSIGNIMDEMKILNKKYGVNYFMTNDELFLVSRKRLFEFRDALKANDLQVKFTCGARVDILDEEIARCLKECGCTFVNIGFESMDQTVLGFMNKRTTVEQNEYAAKVVKEAGLGLGLNLIWGLPGDTEESLRKNVEFIKKWNTYDQLRTIRPVTCYPGCPLYDQAIEQELLVSPEDFFDRFKNSDLITVNFTDMPTEKMYPLLFNANRELIMNHYAHTDMLFEDAKRLIQEFRTLYFVDHDYKFRGSRHYKKEVES